FYRFRLYHVNHSFPTRRSSDLILPTLADITGASIPQNLDGVSFKNSLLGHEAEQKQHDYLYWEFHEQGGKQAVRWKNWKGIKLRSEEHTSELQSRENIVCSPLL